MTGFFRVFGPLSSQERRYTRRRPRKHPGVATLLLLCVGLALVGARPVQARDPETPEEIYDFAQKQLKRG
jgi:hypothetical protein